MLILLIYVWTHCTELTSISLPTLHSCGLQTWLAHQNHLWNVKNNAKVWLQSRTRKGESTVISHRVWARTWPCKEETLVRAARTILSTHLLSLHLQDRPPEPTIHPSTPQWAPLVPALSTRDAWQTTLADLPSRSFHSSETALWRFKLPH